MFKLEGLGIFLVEGRDLGWVGAGQGGAGGFVGIR